MAAKKAVIVVLTMMLTAAMLMIPSGCRQQQPRPAQGSARNKLTIQQIGSTTLLPLAEKWREGFNQEHPDTEIAVAGGG